MHEYIYYKDNYYNKLNIYKNYTLGGSITHYYHFFLGFLIPFLLDIYKDNFYEKTYILDDIFGPMTKILLQLPFDIKIGIDKSNIKYKTRYWKPLDVDIEKRKNNSYITFTYDNYKIINKLFNKLYKHFDLSLNCDKYDVILIERKVDLSYKTTEYQKKNNKYYNIYKTSGSQRRSIQNFQELYLFCISYYKKYKILRISLEYLPFFQQYLLFRNAKIIILQHGAALSNLIFMKPKTTIIEIIPNSLISDKSSNVFYPLSETCKINHYQYITDSNHPIIDINNFKTFLQNI